MFNKFFKRFNEIFNRFLETITSQSNSHPTNKTRGRRLQFETLETREMLSVNLLPVPEYSSLVESPYTIYLDFNGHDEKTSLGHDSEKISQVFDIDDDPTSFSELELKMIHGIWAVTAEMFSPFYVNVTTIDPGHDGLAKSNSSDNVYGVRAQIGPMDGGFGVAWVGHFGSTSSNVGAFIDGAEIYSWNTDPNNWKSFVTAVATTIAHEVGHTLGLGHQGGNKDYPTDDYNWGHQVTDTVRWNPIMGGLSGNVISQWSCGDYIYASNSQNDLNVITSNNGFGYRADESTTALTFSNNIATAGGIIAQTDDADDFTFTVNSSAYYSFDVLAGVTIDHAQYSSLYFYADLYKNDQLVSHNIATLETLTSSFTHFLDSGSYTLRIAGCGYEGSDGYEGFSSYGSLGTYSINVFASILDVPKNLTRTEITKNSVSITWDDVSGATGYVVRYIEQESDSEQWTEQTVNGMNVTITGLSPSQYCYVQVRAKNSNGSFSQWSESILVRSDDVYEVHGSYDTAIDWGIVSGNEQISNLVFAGGSQGEDYYKFTLTEHGIDEDRIHIQNHSNDNDLGIEILGIDGNIVVHSAGLGGNGDTHWHTRGISSLDAGTYIIRVFSRDGWGINPDNLPNANYSIVFTVAEKEPSAPVNFASIAQTTTSVTLSWQPQIGLTGYTLSYKKSGDSNWSTPIDLDASSTTTTITGLNASTQYQFQLTATNTIGSQTSTIISTTSNIVPPTAPANFKVGTKTHDSVTFTWNSQNDLTDYTLDYKKTSDSSWTSWVAPNASATTATITGLSANTGYEFKLTATNAGGSQSSTLSATTNITPPIAPSNFRVDAQTHDSVTLKWDAQSNLTGYVLEYKKSSDSSWTSWAIPNVSATTVTITDLEAETKYDFRIHAENQAGISNWSEINEEQTLEMPYLSVPANPRSIAETQTAIALDWNNVDGATSYVLQRKTGSGSWEDVYSGADSKYVDRSLTADTEYLYRVQAVSSAFSVAISAKTTAKIVNGKAVTDSPIILSAKNENGKTTIAWTDLGAGYRYLVYKDAKLVVNLINTLSYIDDAPSPTTTYSVYAFNDSLQKWSWATPVVVATTAPAIEITGHEVLGNGAIKLQWASGGSECKYMVYQGGYPVTGILNTTEWTDTSPLSFQGDQYQIYTNYIDENSRYQWTWSNLYFIKKPTSSSSASAAVSPLNTFWAEYGLQTDDELLLELI